MYGHSKHGGHGVCQGISMGSENSPLENGLIQQKPEKKLYFIKNPSNKREQAATWSKWRLGVHGIFNKKCEQNQALMAFGLIRLLLKTEITNIDFKILTDCYY